MYRHEIPIKLGKPNIDFELNITATQHRLTNQKLTATNTHGVFKDKWASEYNIKKNNHIHDNIKRKFELNCSLDNKKVLKKKCHGWQPNEPCHIPGTPSKVVQCTQASKCSSPWSEVNNIFHMHITAVSFQENVPYGIFVRRY
jgi:hypothetical protein